MSNQPARASLAREWRMRQGEAQFLIYAFLLSLPTDHALIYVKFLPSNLYCAASSETPVSIARRGSPGAIDTDQGGVSRTP
jgi:hypothetical protein